MSLTAPVTGLSAASLQPVLLVPQVSSPLHLRMPAPAGLMPAAGQTWQLVDLDHPGDASFAMLAPCEAADGTVASGRWQLLATVHNHPNAKTSRRFRLEALGDAGGRQAEAASFRFEDQDEKRLRLWEGPRPVLVYNHGIISRAGVPADRNRSTYVHPIYGLDGEVLTDDFPADHHHHRGLFWAWPHVAAGGQHYDLWELKGIRQQFERWLARETSAAAAVLGVENGWYASENKVMLERVWFYVYPASQDQRAIDIDFTWVPVRQPVTLAGAEGKSYGGLTLRFAPRTQTVITTPLGNASEDAYMTPLPWADLSAQFTGVPRPSGAAILIAPDHPDFPPTWLTRHYGVLCVGWPGVTPKRFPVGEPIRCRYRVWVHRDLANGAELAGAYAALRAGDDVRWEPAGAGWLNEWRKSNSIWRGVQLSVTSDGAADALATEVPRLAALGVNTLVIEVDYGFAFESHPELGRERGLTKAGAARLAKVCREKRIRPIPLFNCLGHQSWSRTTFPLLAKYPELDETPGQYPDNKDIYCRSWCPQHPDVNRIVFALIDELVDAFSADAVHVGMDEVFLIASTHCPRCKGGDPAKLFAKAVNDLHEHIVGKRKLEMLMWGDRLLDAATMGYGEWESAKNGTHPAVDLIPRDIIICDWHYEKRAEYPSIPFLLGKGFKVWPSGWNKVEATEALIDCAQRHRSPQMMGHLCTTWGAVRIPQLPEWPPILTAMKRWAN
jgi:hypothetical protein